MTNDQGPLTIHEAAAAIQAGRLTPVDLLDQCLKRIDRYEHAVRAWVVIDRDGAREQAERLTVHLERRQNHGPLYGIPIGIKDIIDVFDLPTGCGSRLWATSYARQDARCVKNLRSAGAIILGKTVTTAYASFDPPVTRNPWQLDRTPGGSSSGSAAAVACGMGLGALGSQTGGSITRPAAFCGVASCKPSWGRVSVEGVLPLAPSMDHVGVMARCVRDVAFLLEPLLTHELAGPVPPRALIRFGRPRGLFQDKCDPELWEHLSRMDGIRVPLGGAEAAVEVIDVALPAAFVDVWHHHHTIMAAEAADYHGERFRRRPDDYPPKIAGLIEDGLRLSGAACVAAYNHRADLRREFVPLFEDVSALLTPAAPGLAPGWETTGDPVFNSPWSYLGLPTVSFPVCAGGDRGVLPLAVQLVGKPSGERELLAVAAAVEEQVGWAMGMPPVPKE
jgi:aspartyl-tRNA(Asn)/glutamyl-tRNA(Gln) amidotransferase subunit A